ncbi:protein shortage in chiasmata 1 ortholog isoform X3 [Ascaphus truei]
MLPCKLEVHMNDDSKESGFGVSELIILLGLTPEMETDEHKGQTVTEGFLTKTTGEVETFEHHLTKQDVDSAKYENILDPACYSSYHLLEVEMPLTPPCSTFKPHADTLGFELKAEEMSPPLHNLLITDSAKETLENSVCHSELYPMLLKVPVIQDSFQHWTIMELKEKISINPEILTCVTLGNKWWSESGLNATCTITIEQLNTHSFSANNLSSRMETFTAVTAAQLERMLEEKASCMKQRTSLQNSKKQPNSPGDSPPKIKLSSSPWHWELNVAPSDTQVNVDLVTDGKEQDKTHAVVFSAEEEEFRKNSLLTTRVLSLNHVNPLSTTPSKTHDASKNKDTGLYGLETQPEDTSDLLSNFIMLRTRQIRGQPEDKVTQELPVLVLEAEALEISTPELKEDTHLSSDVISEVRAEEDTEDYRLSVNIQASDSQCQAYRILEAAAIPVLDKLIGLGVTACMDWKFASVNFDCTRFFLRQQEKTVSDSCKVGKKDEKEIMLFKHAALFHILVTVRDLVLMCSFDTALGYLCEAKEMYKSALGSCFDDVWRKLEIVQYVRESKQEINPKITALHDQLSQWRRRNTGGDKPFKVLVITRIGSDDTKGTIVDILSKMKDFKAIALRPAEGRRFLERKNVLDSLVSCSCIIVTNQHIGAHFPWDQFSLVVEYDCTAGWLKICQDLKVPYMTLQTCLPDPILMGETSLNSFGFFQLDIQVPYVFLTSEGLLNNPEILQLMESKYNITCIERSSSASLQLFGGTERCALITVDESTAIIMQNLEELKCDKSSESIILKLVALSLQYSCCWIVLYSKERINSEYSLPGNILQNLALMYAALVPFTSKSEELEVKVLISPGVEETGLLIQRIAEHTVMRCKSDPYKWLDKSWLSVLPSEAEECLLAFPCINPMVAQLMLHRGSSLQWLLSATIDQLQELLPEVPSKVLKHFTDITSLHQLSTSASPPRHLDMSPLQRPENCSSPYHFPHSVGRSLSAMHEHDKRLSDPHLSDNIRHRSAAFEPYRGSLKTTDIVVSDHSIKSFPSYQGEATKHKAHQYTMYGQNQTFLSNIGSNKECSQKLVTPIPFSFASSHTVTEPTVPSQSFGLHSTEASLDFLRPHQRTMQSEIISEHAPHSAYLMDNFADHVFCNQEEDFPMPVYHQRFKVHHGNAQNPCSLTKTNNFFTDLLGLPQKTPVYYRDELEDVIYVSPPRSTEKPWDLNPSGQRTDVFDSVPFTKASQDLFDDLHFNQLRGDLAVQKRSTVAETVLAERIASTGIQTAQQPQLKRRKLSFEKVPGRCDGQTRLKFF